MKYDLIDVSIFLMMFVCCLTVLTMDALVWLLILSGE